MMTFGDYQVEARRTQRKDLPLWAMREHALYGLSSEVGEIMGMHQKIHQGHEMDVTALRLEIGDALWFLFELCDVYGFEMEDVVIANIQKRRVRYKGDFTARESRARVDVKKKPPVKTKYYSRVKEGEKDG